MEFNIETLEKYYSSEHEKKIFCTKLCVEGRNFEILYDYDKENEINSFISNFSEYLPYYVFPADALECIDMSGEISKKLQKISKQCWNGPIIPTREYKVNGIFGELFLDFYERIIKKDKLVATYACRRDFRSNSENKGFDNVFFNLKNDEIEFVFAESKFVANKSHASSSLINDIKGEAKSENKEGNVGHLTTDFMNEYISFIVAKNAFFSDSDKKLLKPFICELNNVLINQKGNFISFMIEKGIRVNCVFFAVFQNQSVNPSDYIDTYDRIYNEAKSHLEHMGIKNYTIEIVFIPTHSKSTEIKGAIDEYYK